MKHLRIVLSAALVCGRVLGGVNEGAYEVLENGSGRFRVEIEGCPVASSNVESITVEDLVIDEREMTTGADWDYRVYGPGDAHYGSISIKSRVGNRESSSELAAWFYSKQTVEGEGGVMCSPECGREIRKDITINILKQDGGTARTYNFLDCFPVSFEKGAEFETLVVRPEGFECDGTDPDPTSGEPELRNGFRVEMKSEQARVELLTDWAWDYAQGGALCMEKKPLPFGDPEDFTYRSPTDPKALSLTDIQLKGPLTTGRRAMCQWITATVQGKDWKRTITLTDVKESNGKDGKSFPYHECLPIRYRFPSLDAAGTGELLYEEITVKPIRLELA